MGCGAVSDKYLTSGSKNTHDTLRFELYETDYRKYYSRVTNLADAYKNSHQVPRLGAAITKGATDMLPLSLAVLPFGVLFGSLVIQKGFTWLEGQLFSVIIFSGAVQLVTVELVAKDTPFIALLFMALVVSSRHFLYGLRLRDPLSKQSVRWRIGLGFLMTDELFAFSSHRRSYASKYRLYYALGAGGSFYVAWNIWTAVGIFAGVALPDLSNLGLDFAVAAVFIALVIPEVKTVPTLVCVLASATSSLLFLFYGFELGLIASAGIGMLCGYGMQRARS